MSKLNPKLEVGDRIVLLHMSDSYSAVKPGTSGTVISIQKTPFGDRTDYNYIMDWDNGSSLSLEPDVDTWVLKSDYDKKKKTVEESYKVYETLYEEYKKRGVI
jgi:hypothetical protein